jgi:tetratricopeptide (TPR) repeat protein
LRLIEGELPEQTLALRERAAEVDRLLAVALRLRADVDEDARRELATVLNNLGIRLSALGRREEALQAAHEAVGLYRQLAAQRPDAFLPDLAMSLDTRGTVLREMGDAAGAAASFRDGVECLKPLFLRWPDAFKPLMTTLVRAYVGACETAGMEVDLSLLSDVSSRLPDDKEDTAAGLGGSSHSRPESLSPARSKS